MTNFNFKQQELSIDTANIWTDDKLDSKLVADGLTKLIENQSNSLVMTINGKWGSGKTFLLQRWQADLEYKGYKAIYFNAWEADFCTDPLIAIIGQLWDKLKESDFKEVVNTVKQTAKPLLMKTVFNSLKFCTGSILDIKSDDLKSDAENSIDEYFSQMSLIKELKKHLESLSRKIFDETSCPLIFIIDELDRCRPTFSIELLEKVKHIFNVENIIFVLGIDRKQLGYSIGAVYGNIDIDGYLRRFIDIDFALNTTNHDAFCNHLFDIYNINSFFKEKDKKIGRNFHTSELFNFKKNFISLCRAYKMSLRDIEHAIRKIVLVAINLKDGYFMFPEILSLLIVLKIKDENLYKEYSSGSTFPSVVINEVQKALLETNKKNNIDNHYLNFFEAQLYATGYDKYGEVNTILQQLKLLEEGKKADKPEYLSERTKSLNKENIGSILHFYNIIINNIRGDISKATLKYLTDLIEVSSLNLKEYDY